MSPLKETFYIASNITAACTLTNTLGYGLLNLVSYSTAMMIGSLSTIITASIIGSTLLLLPILITNYWLTHLIELPKSVDTALSLSFICGSSILGASLLGIAILPTLICSLIGTTIIGLIGLYDKKQTNQEATEASNIRLNSSTFSI